MIKQITSKCVAKVWVTSCDCPQSEFVQPSLLFSISDPRKEKAARCETVGCPLNSPTQHGTDTKNGVYKKRL